MARRLDTEVRRKQIVRAALDILARDGAAGLGVAAVAHRVGIVPSAIYRHFSGMEAIVDAVVDSIADQLAENVRHARAFSEDPLERIESLLEGHARLIRENRGFARLLFSGELGDGPPARREKLLAMIEGYLARVRAIVEEGRESGRLGPDADPTAVTHLYLGLIQPAAFLHYLSDGAYEVTREVGKAWRIVRRGLEVKEVSQGGDS